MTAVAPAMATSLNATLCPENKKFNFRAGEYVKKAVVCQHPPGCGSDSNNPSDLSHDFRDPMKGTWFSKPIRLSLVPKRPMKE
jgi:hypothetical protein